MRGPLDVLSAKLALVAIIERTHTFVQTPFRSHMWLIKYLEVGARME